MAHNFMFVIKGYIVDKYLALSHLLGTGSDPTDSCCSFEHDTRKGTKRGKSHASTMQEKLFSFDIRVKGT